MLGQITYTQNVRRVKSLLDGSYLHSHGSGKFTLCDRLGLLRRICDHGLGGGWNCSFGSVQELLVIVADAQAVLGSLSAPELATFKTNNPDYAALYDQISTDLQAVYSSLDNTLASCAVHSAHSLCRSHTRNVRDVLVAQGL